MNRASAQITYRPQEQPRPKIGQLRLWIVLLGRILFVIAVYTLVKSVSVNFVVSGNSMLSTLESGEFLFVSRANYLFTEPEHGDIVVFHYPADPSVDFIKRVIGLPGETVELRRQQVYVNGVLLEEPYINESCSINACEDRFWQLGADEYFVMGDNRNASTDSRSFGPIKRSTLVGEAIIRYWPLAEVGLIHKIGFPHDGS